MVVIHQEKVVEVAADLLRRCHGGVNVELVALGEGGEDAGQHGRLNVARHVQLRADALLFRGDAAEILNIFIQLRHHVLERMGKLLQLVAGVDLHPKVGQGRHLALHQPDGGVVQNPQRADQNAPHIVVVRENGKQQNGQHHAQRQAEKLPDLLVDHVHRDVHAGQRHRCAGFVEDGDVGRRQIAVLLVVGDEDGLFRVDGKGTVHQLVAAAVVGVGVAEVADAVLAGNARVPDVVHDLILRHDHIEVFQSQLLPDVLQVAVDLLVIGVLLAGPVVLLHAVSVDEIRRHGSLTERERGVLLLHPRPVQLSDRGGQDRREDGGHRHQSQQQLGL